MPINRAVKVSIALVLGGAAVVAAAQSGTQALGAQPGARPVSAAADNGGNPNAVPPILAPLSPWELAEVRRAEALALGAVQQRALLAVLVLHRGEVVSVGRLVDELWGERVPAAAAKTVQVYVSHLRKALGGGVIVTQGRAYRLAVAPEQVDAVRFEALRAEGRRALASGDAARAKERLCSALGLWRGEPLAEFAYEPFAQAA